MTIAVDLGRKATKQTNKQRWQNFQDDSTDLKDGPILGSTKLMLPTLIDFSLTVKAFTLIFISGRGSHISSAKEGKSGCIYNLVKSY